MAGRRCRDEELCLLDCSARKCAAAGARHAVGDVSHTPPTVATASREEQIAVLSGASGYCVRDKCLNVTCIRHKDCSVLAVAP